MAGEAWTPHDKWSNKCFLFINSKYLQQAEEPINRLELATVIQAFLQVGLFLDRFLAYYSPLKCTFPSA